MKKTAKPKVVKYPCIICGGKLTPMENECCRNCFLNIKPNKK